MLGPRLLRSPNWLHWIGALGLGLLATTPVAQAQGYDAPGHKECEICRTHCDPCTGGIDSELEPCDDWQLVVGRTGPGGTGDVDEAYHFDAVAGQTYIFSFCEQGGTASYDTSLSIWNSTCSGGLLVCNDDFCGLLSRLQWTASSTGTFTLRVGGFGGSTGDYTLAYRAVGVACGGLRVEPDQPFMSSGLQGGPFDPSSFTYTVSNNGEGSLDYQVSKTANWISLDDGSGPGNGPLVGSLAPQDSVPITVIVNDQADQLPVGEATDLIQFSNLTNGDGDTTRRVALRVLDRDAPQLIVNGDFETGDFTGWEIRDTGSGGFENSDGSFDPPGPDGPLPPCQGSFTPMTFQSGPGRHTLVQQVNLLAGFDIATLSWTDRIRNHAGRFSDPNQEFRVEIRDAGDNVLEEVFSTNPGDQRLNDCQMRSFDISQFAEQTIRVALTQEDNLSFFNLHVDDVKLTLGRTNRPPMADAGPDQSVECGGPDGAEVILDGSGSSDPDSSPGTNDDIVAFDWYEDFGLPSEVFLGQGELLGVTLPLGSHVITLEVTDRAGVTDTDDTVASIVDTLPPTVSVLLRPSALWPPNHRLVTTHATVLADDVCDVSDVVLDSVTSSEPDNAPGGGDGNTTGDIRNADIGTPDYEFELRAERAGTGDGRTYTAVYRATDGSGNSATGEDDVIVAHDQSGITDPLDLLVQTEDDGTTVEWRPVAGAQHYDVIRGDLDAITETVDHIDLGSVVCIERYSPDTDTAGSKDVQLPAVGQAFFYLIEYLDGDHSSYGTESASKPRIPASGDCH